MNEPLISVVIPCHNGAKHLPECVRSVLDQQTNCEIIAVDDGSTDDTPAVARSLMQSCPMPLIAISQRNAGPAAARNLGLRAAAGKYICFLDVDDRYKPGFFPLAVQALEANADAVAIYCPIEIVGTHRPVEDWQRREAEHCLPGNIILRTEAARQLGGFPVHPAFRGRAAGEDVTFRAQLFTLGKVLATGECYFQYHVAEGSHFHFFLDRSSLKDGRLVIHDKTPEELDGSVGLAQEEYRSQIQRRLAEQIAVKLKECFASTQSYGHLAAIFQRISGSLHPYGGYVLYSLARYWPIVGRVVEIGNCQGQSTCWMAAGCKEGNRTPVAVIDSDPVTLPFLQSILAEFAMSEKAVILGGPAAEVARSWNEPIRLLFLDGQHPSDAITANFSLWSRFLVGHGLVVCRGIGILPGITQFFERLLAQNDRWSFFGQFNSLGVLVRIDSPEKANP